MRIRSGAAILAFVALAAGHEGRAQEPDETGEHAYAGEVCLWSSFSSGHYIEMEFHKYKGRINARARVDEIAATPFEWRMTHPDGTVTSSSDSTAEGALNGLCGAMIVAHVRAREAESYDRDDVFQELLEAARRER